MARKRKKASLVALPGAVEAPMPMWLEPMKATLTDDRFSDPDWVFEPKLDGERCLAFKNASGVRLMSRNQKAIGVSYPEIVSGLAAQPFGEAILDGEIVAFDEKGVPRKDVRWVEPDLVVQIGFSEWTPDARLRHPRFLGLRRDKPAREVVREDA